MKYRMREKPGSIKLPKFTSIKTAQKGAKFRTNGKRTAVKVLFTFLGILTGVLFIGGMIGSVLAVGYLGSINASLPDASKLATAEFEQSTKIFDRNGTLLYTLYGDQNREYVSLSKIPDKTKWALLATEDSNFYEHKGVDFARTFKGALDFASGQSIAGRSTITQQYARNTVLYQIMGENAFNRDPTRKIKEILIALQLENKLSKDQILELYMNQVSLGGTTYGYQQGAHEYFNKDVGQLDLSESAVLAGVIQSPSYYRNALILGDTDIVKKRRDDVLDLMLKFRDKTGVTDEEVAKAKEEPIVYNPGKVTLTAPHFVFYVIDQLKQQYGEDVLRTGGLRITTTLDLNMQKIAEDELASSIGKFKTWYGVNNGAIVVENPKNGEILAMVGSVDYNNTSDKRVDGNVNVAVMPRQMGSSTKPYTYIEAFHQGYNPGSLAPDIQFNFGAYKPTDWNKTYEGLETVRTALNHSRNVPAVYMLQTIGGPDIFLNAMDKLGFTTFTDRSRYGLSVTLGAGDMKLIEHTNGFATFANRGTKYDTSVVLEIKDNKGNVIFKNDPSKSEKRVYSEEETFLMNWILCQMGGRDDKGAASLYYAAGTKFCGKTGTTNGPKDLITIAYTPRVVVGIWTGNNDGQLTFGTHGQGWSENVPIVIAHNLMGKYIPIVGKESYVQPAGVVAGSVCKDTGLGADSGTKCDKESTIFLRSQLPAKDNAHIYLPICTKTGKIPTNEAEARAAGLVQDKLYLDFQLPNKAQQSAYDNYVTSKLGYSLIKDKPDTAPCDPDVPLPTITITSPANDSIVTQGSSFSVHTSPSATAPAAVIQVTFYFDDAQVGLKTSSPYSMAYATNGSTSIGAHTVKATVLDSLGRVASTSITINVVGAPTPTPTATPTASPTVTPTLTITPTP